MEYRRRDAKRTWERVNQGWGVSAVQSDHNLPSASWASGDRLGVLLVWLEQLVLWPPAASAGYCPLVPW